MTRTVEISVDDLTRTLDDRAVAAGIRFGRLSLPGLIAELCRQAEAEVGHAAARPRLAEILRRGLGDLWRQDHARRRQVQHLASALHQAAARIADSYATSGPDDPDPGPAPPPLDALDVARAIGAGTAPLDHVLCDLAHNGDWQRLAAPLAAIPNPAIALTIADMLDVWRARAAAAGKSLTESDRWNS